MGTAATRPYPRDPHARARPRIAEPRGSDVMLDPWETTSTCQACGATFVNERALFRHTEEVHGGGSAGRNTDDVPGADIPAVERGP
jgi:hypothetical protein